MPKPSDIHGVLLVDKPADITSFDVVRRLKPILKTGKIGHTGTLDPFATGLLVLCVGHYTRFVPYLMGGKKRYIAEVQLGVETTTDDLEGDIVQTRNVPPDWALQLQEIVGEFHGKIVQQPSPYSAIHIDGKRAYERARAGEKVDMPERTVNIHELTVTEIHDAAFQLDVTVSSGTYIRTLGRDIGQRLGCGAHLRSLRRVENALFHVQDAWTLDRIAAISDRESLPWIRNAAALIGWPKLTLDAEAIGRLMHGKLVAVSADVAIGIHVVVAANGQLIGLVEINHVHDLDEETEDAIRAALGEPIAPFHVARVKRLMPTGGNPLS